MPYESSPQASDARIVRKDNKTKRTKNEEGEII